MLGLFSVSPWVWVGALVLLAATGATGFVAGIDWQQGRQALGEVKVLVRKIEVIKYVAKKDNEQSAKYEREKAALEAEMDELRREYAGLRKKLDERDGVCDLPADVLRLLNRARAAGRAAADPGKPDAAVPAAAATGGREAGSGGRADAR